MKWIAGIALMIAQSYACAEQAYVGYLIVSGSKQGVLKGGALRSKSGRIPVLSLVNKMKPMIDYPHPKSTGKRPDNLIVTAVEAVETPALKRFLATKQEFELQLEFVRPKGKGQVEVYRYARVFNVRPASTTPGPKSATTFTFAYDRMVMEAKSVRTVGVEDWKR